MSGIDVTGADPIPETDDAEHTEALDALRAAVRTLLHRTPGEGAWAKLCGEIEVASLAVPERFGGAGAGLPEVCVVLEELGRTLTPAPMLGSAVIATTALLGTGDDEACARLLPRVARGDTVASLVWAGERGTWDPLAPVCHWDGRLHGTAHYVLDGAAADVFVVAARDERGWVRLFEVDPGDTVRAAAVALDGSRPLATVTFDGCAARPLGADVDHAAALANVRDVGCVALAAEQVGASAHCLDATVAYTQQRVQYGHPIALFQALQHRMADLYVQVETARSAVWAAARAGGATLPLLAAVAKTHASETACRAAAEMVQIHGGIAITWEHEAHRYFKRAHGSAQLLGQPHEHVTRLAARVL
ncbi:acyl-CoA dehydrogenase family protein [Pseudonocardia spinosispora]|uniref:acyl-CoA dehydrogenase family protein n=1 Tax=Pseudonocardia spinosispora TaxID=103441 RepID=UPI0004060529|nr:acyl-CoA dehydrogenase family protein [Pseudonocardia spinosispora]